MVSWRFGSVSDNERRLITAIETSASETPVRVVFVLFMLILLGQFVAPWMMVTAGLVIFADDFVLLWGRDRLRLGLSMNVIKILAASNFLAATAMACFLAAVMLFGNEPAGRIGALVAMIAVLIELASPKARTHPFVLLTFLPVWTALFGSLTVMVVLLEFHTLPLWTGILVTVIGAAYVGFIFIENVRNTDELERETERANLANARKGRFLATMSHEIRTPLHAIYGSAQLLQTSTDPQDMRRLGEILLAAAADLKVIVDDVVDYERAEAGLTDLVMQVVDPRTLADRAADLFRANAMAKGLVLEVHCSEDLGGQAVHLDPVRVSQVLSNLLSNAVNFTSEGTITLRVERAAADAMLRFVVRDSGAGIPPEMRSRIFLPHENPTGRDGRSQTGAGLGLAISQLLARRMGGSLELVETGGAGAEFVLGLPFVPVAGDAVDRVADAALPVPAQTSMSAVPLPQAGPVPAFTLHQVTGRSLAGKRILVVDDVAINREVLRAMLERHGADILEAENGLRALEVIKSEAVDVMLLDNAMPVMSGQDALIDLRAQSGPQSRMTVIGISAGTIREERDTFISHGLDGFLAKPVSVPDLIRMITETFPRQAVTDQPSHGAVSVQERRLAHTG